MPDERVIQKVREILEANEIEFRTSESNESFLVFRGSAAVCINFVDWEESTLVGLLAILLQEINSSGARKEKILETLNERIKTIPFGTFYFDTDERYVVLAHHLLGDQLQGPELMSALDVIATTADEVDDELREMIGSGIRAIDAWNSHQGGEAVGVGPVVDT